MDEGFTLLDVLLTLTIITVTIPFIAFLLSDFQAASTLEEDLSVQQFFLFIRNDTLMAKDVYGDNNKMYFIVENNETAKIEQYQDVIRRQVDGKGHEIYLREIATFSVQSLSYGSKISVTTLKGETYEKTIAHYKK